MENRSKFALGPIFVIVFLACAAQAAVPVSPPESRFVWGPGENLTFTWTNENFDGFNYDSQSRAGRESLTIKIDNIKDRYIPKNGITYFKTPGQTTTHYSFSSKYAVLESRNEKYLVESPEEKNDVRRMGDNQIWLHKILIDNNKGQKVENGSRLSLFNGHDIEVRGVNLSDASVLLSLKMDGIDMDTRDLDVGEDFIYEAKDGQIIAVHVDSVITGGEGNSVLLNGIFQTSERFTQNLNGEIFGMMAITDVSDTGITIKNTAGIVELKPGRIIDIGVENLRLKVADSNKLRVILYCDPFITKNETRGAVHTDLNRLMTWDGLNYAGFWYDIASGNYSGSLEITNITGRRIPKGGLIYKIDLDRLTYTNYMASVPSVAKIKDQEPHVTDWSYVTFNLGGNMYFVKSKNPGILTAHGVTYYDKKDLGIGQYEFKGENWELGEGYTLMAISADLVQDPRKVRLVLNKNGVEIENVWLTEKDVYRYTQTETNETPKLITYIEYVFAGSTIDVFQLRNTWFVSDNITRIKEGEMLGVFNATVVEPDRIVLTNMESIELKAGSIINLLGNLSFFVENSDELRFYPTNMGGTQMVPKEVTVNKAPDGPDAIIPAGTSPVEGRTETAAGFEVIISLAAFFAVYRIKGRKNR